ncbi:MAG: MipA/OmpV family protein [Pseudomonadota bacterium]
MFACSTPRTGRALVATLCALSASTGTALQVHAEGSSVAASPPALEFGLVPDAGTSPNATLSTQTSEKDRRLIFTVLLGAESRPGYFGSDENITVGRISPNLVALNFGQVDVGNQSSADAADPNARPLGFGVAGSFRFVTERSSDDFDELEGLDDVDLSVEIGAQVGYVWPSAEAFGALRYGAIGHESWVGEIGANYVARPADDFALRVGPRLLFGSDNYADTYFGVSADEAAASDFSEYDPDGGLVSAGVEVIATYRLGEQWWLEGRARWDQLQADAADSPIVEQGTVDQGTVSIGVRRAFVLDF